MSDEQTRAALAGYRPPHPYETALIQAGALVGVLAVASGILWILWRAMGGGWSVALILTGGLAALMAVVWTITWLMGARGQRRARRFLRSARLLAAWVYTPAEWKQLQDQRWADERDDWKLQWGGLAVIFGLMGTLLCALIGWEEGLPEAAIGAVLGAVAGAAVGSVLALGVAGGGHWAARRASRRLGPVVVALGCCEVYDGTQYFGGDGVRRYIQEAKWEGGAPGWLVVNIFSPKVRGTPRKCGACGCPPHNATGWMAFGRD